MATTRSNQGPTRSRKSAAFARKPPSTSIAGAALDSSTRAKRVISTPLAESGWLQRQGRTVNATQAKNRFGVILKRIGTEPVFIQKHESVRAVVIGYDSYRALVEKARTPQEVELDKLRSEFERMYAGMQTEKSRRGVDALLRASADELNTVVAKRTRARG